MPPWVLALPCIGLASLGLAPVGAPAATLVGNAVRAWPGVDIEAVAIVDVGLCFLQSGQVVALEAYVHGVNASGAWPHFYAAEPLGGRLWSMHAEASVLDDGEGSFAGAMRLELTPPLQVFAGQCLCWRYPPGVKGAIAFAAWPGELWHGPPEGTDAAALAMLTQAPHGLRLSETLRFERAEHRRYSLQAILVPAETSIATVPGDHFSIIPRRRSGEHRDWVSKCWGENWALPLFCCLPAGLGKPACFGGELSSERCCSPAVVGPLGFDPSAARLPEPLQVSLVDAGGTPRDLPGIRVDMFVRTFHPKLEELMVLMQSVAVFWPPRWGAIIALDGGSEADAITCKLVPKWARCVLVERPPFYDHLNLTFPSLGGLAAGMVWKEWSECWADSHSTADFIAIMDSDVVLTTFGIPQLLFEADSGGKVRPVLWGHAHENYFPSTVAELGLPKLLDFMDSFPLTLHREDFAYIRAQVTLRFGRPGQRRASAKGAFNRAFVAYVKAVHKASVAAGGGGECPSFHAMAGSLLWHGRRIKYTWHIRHGHLVGVPLEFTCPRLRIAHHVPYWGHEHTDLYPIVSLKSHVHIVNPLGSLGYAARAVALIMAGLCEVPWRQRRTMNWRLKQRLTFVSNLNRTDALRNKGLEDVHRDFCAHGTQLLGGVSDPFQRLLSWRFPATPVSDAEVAYCGDRRPSVLRREYRRLMGVLAFTPGRTADDLP